MAERIGGALRSAALRCGGRKEEADARAARRRPPTAAAAGGSPPPPPRTVLVVSRDHDFRVIYGTALRHAGYRAVVLGDPENVVAVVLVEGAELVVTEFPTCDAHGHFVATLLRAEARTARIRILGVTGHVLPLEIARAHTAGLSHVLPMPVLPATLVECVARLLAGPARSEAGLVGGSA